MTEPLLVIAVIACMFAVVWAAGRWGGANLSERIDCPEKHLEVEATFARRLSLFWAPAARTDVVACSAFSEPRQVTCAKVCLRAGSHTL